MFKTISKSIRAYVLRAATRSILNFVTLQDVLRIENGRVFVHGRELRPDEIQKIKIESEYILNSSAATYLVDVLAYGTQERIMREGADEYDLWTARSIRLFIAQFHDALRTFAQLDKSKSARTEPTLS